MLSLSGAPHVFARRVIGHRDHATPVLYCFPYITPPTTREIIGRHQCGVPVLLQFLAVGHTLVNSYGFLTRMHSLAFLNADQTDSYACSAVPSGAQLRSLTSLTNLSISGVPVAITTLQALTQLRVLCIGSDDKTGRFDGALTLASLHRDLLSSLSHLTRLDYHTQRFLERVVPPKVAELGLRVRASCVEWDDVAAFRGWKHPLPCDYFSRIEDTSRFMNGHAFLQ